MKVVIRKGEEKDIARALQLVQELAIYERCPEEVVVSEQQMKDWGFGANKIFDFFVAEENEIIHGIALYYYKYSTWKGKCIFLEDIIVTETMRGRGIGKKLFDAVAAVAKKENVKRLEWQVLEWNETAINFYKKYKATFDSGWINCKLTDEQLKDL